MAKKLSDDVREDDGSAARAKSNVPPELYLEHVHAMALAKRGVEEAKAVLKRARKRAKADGVNLKAHDANAKLYELDPDEAAERLRTMQKYAAWEGRPVGFQSLLFDPAMLDAPKDSAQRRHEQCLIEDDGYQAGLHDAPREECPHMPGSESAASWMRGHTAAREFMQRLGGSDTSDLIPKKLSRGRKTPAAKPEAHTTH